MIMIVFLIILIVLVGLDFIRLKKLNSMDGNVLISELEGLSAYEFRKIEGDSRVKFDDDFEKNRYVSFSSMNESDFYDYKKIVAMWYMADEYPIKDAIFMDFNFLWNEVNFNMKKFEKYLKKLNITKKDKLLIICYGGGSSRVISYLFNKYGYDSYYASLNTINNEELIDSEELKNNNNIRNIVIDSLNYDIDEKYYIFLFGVGDECLINHFSKLIGEGGLKENIYGIESGRFSIIEIKKEHPNIEIANVENVDIEESEIICLSQLHCLLTQHKIDSLNLGIKKIYYAGDIENWGK